MRAYHSVDSRSLEKSALWEENVLNLKYVFLKPNILLIKHVKYRLKYTKVYPKFFGLSR
jgi:hypothetical protein